MLFAMADARLSEEEQNGLLERLEEFEVEHIGSGVHETSTSSCIRWPISI